MGEFLIILLTLVVDAGLPDFVYNLVFIVSALFMLIVAPRLAAKTDRNGGLIKYLNYSTVFMAIFLGAAALAPVYSWNAYWAALLFFMGFTGYQMSFVFFNPLLNDLADAAHRGRASGWPQFANAAGMIAGLLVFAPLAKTSVGALILSVIAFFVLSLPLMLLYHENKRTVKNEPAQPTGLKKFRQVFAIPGGGRGHFIFFLFPECKRHNV